MATKEDVGPKLPAGLDPKDWFVVNGRYVDCNGEPAAKAAAKLSGASEADVVRAEYRDELGQLRAQNAELASKLEEALAARPAPEAKAGAAEAPKS